MNETEPERSPRLGRGFVTLAITNIVLVALVVLLLWLCADLQDRNERLEMERLKLDIYRLEVELRALEQRVGQASENS